MSGGVTWASIRKESLILVKFPALFPRSCLQNIVPAINNNGPVSMSLKLININTSEKRTTRQSGETVNSSLCTIYCISF